MNRPLAVGLLSLLLAACGSEQAAQPPDPAGREHALRACELFDTAPERFTWTPSRPDDPNGPMFEDTFYDEEPYAQALEPAVSEAARAAEADRRWSRLYGLLDWLVTVLRQHGDDARLAARGGGAHDDAARECAAVRR
jgi:hypothetical protein